MKPSLYLRACGGLGMVVSLQRNGKRSIQYYFSNMGQGRRLMQTKGESPARFIGELTSLGMGGKPAIFFVYKPSRLC